MRILCLIALTVAVAGCGEQARSAPPEPAGYSTHGLSVDLPPGWEPAAQSLTPALADPREQLSVGTYPLRYRQMGCAHVPSSALADLGDSNAFVTIEERGRAPGADWSEFAPRPAHFGPVPQDGSEAPDCVPGSPVSVHRLRFTDGGRHFYALVAFGPHTPAARRAEAWSILDSLGVDPQVRPDWKLAG